jgi:O-antigen/teichoic acid export membrane protein
VILSLFLNYLLINIYGLTGAAFSLLIIGIIGTLLFSIHIYKEFHTLINMNTILRNIFAGLIITCLIIIIKNLILIENIWIIPFYLMIFGIYYIILWYLKEINKNDIKMIISLFRFTKI